MPLLIYPYSFRNKKEDPLFIQLIGPQEAPRDTPSAEPTSEPKNLSENLSRNQPCNPSIMPRQSLPIPRGRFPWGTQPQDIQRGTKRGQINPNFPPWGGGSRRPPGETPVIYYYFGPRRDPRVCIRPPNSNRYTILTSCQLVVSGKGCDLI